MNRRMVLPLLVALLVTLLGSGIALAASGPAVDWWVISGGGAPSSSGGNVTLNDTLGQPVIGPSGSGSAALNAGYWVGCAAAPAGVPIVSVAREGADVVLSWDANLVNSQYQVWISTDPYFDPEHPGGVAPILWPASPYRDTGAAASRVNHFYVVRGLNPCGAASGSSVRKGEFTFGLTPGN
jgi:hypothetical protein